MKKPWAGEFQMANKDSNFSQVAHDSLHTDEDWIYCNVDASILNGNVTFGVVVLSHRDEFMTAISESIEPSNKAHHLAEALAIKVSCLG
nr:hypothetical protein Itr_chr08CG16300 [Ipomoea trifida]